MLDKELLEQQIASLPVFQYAFLKTEELVFSERVRHICKTECPMYGMSWACPPAVGTVEACKKACMDYPEFLMVSSVNEVEDIENMELTLATRCEHEKLTAQIVELIRRQGAEVKVLSTEACSLCEKCTYPEGPCRFPERMFPCVESHGILVTELAERCGMEFFNGNIVTWFSVILYR